MKIINILVAIFFTTFICSGCATGPKFADFKKDIPLLQPSTARIYFYRTNPLGGDYTYSMWQKIILNGQVVGKAVPGGFFYVDRPPGDYQVVVSSESTRNLSLSLKPGQTAYVMIDFEFGVGNLVKCKLVEELRALADMEGCRFSGKK